MAAPVEPFALYVHVPWCRHVCPYCDFNVRAAARPPADRDAAALAGEIAAWAGRPPWRDRAVKSVYLGGGTPSLFPPAAIATILESTARAFGIEPGAEITLEANPGTVTPASLAGYRTAGVNRLSLGVQSFHPALLRTLGRDHGPDDTRSAVAAARAAGFTNVSLDLIYAVPGQTVADGAADLDAALALAPEHVSAYCLTWEAGTPFAAWRTSGRVTPVDEDTEATLAEQLAQRLQAAGFVRYEISSWGRPGFAARHNQSYWNGSDYLGVGAGAHSYQRMPAPGVRFANLRDPVAWREAVTRDGTAVATTEALTLAQARGEFVMTGLRQLAGVDSARFAGRFGVSLEAAFPQVTELLRDDLLERAGDRLRLTPRGLVFADAVAARFL